VCRRRSVRLSPTFSRPASRRLPGARARTGSSAMHSGRCWPMWTPEDLTGGLARPRRQAAEGAAAGARGAQASRAESRAAACVRAGTIDDGRRDALNGQARALPCTGMASHRNVALTSSLQRAHLRGDVRRRRARLVGIGNISARRGPSGPSNVDGRPLMRHLPEWHSSTGRCVHPRAQRTRTSTAGA
jgi:hypothetical protein